VPVDLNNLPDDAKALQKMVVDLTAQLDRETTERSKLEALIRELIDAKRNRKSEKLSKEQLALFEAAWQAKTEQEAQDTPNDQDADSGAAAGEESKPETKKRPARQPLARNVKRERIVHDLSSGQKHCCQCDQDLRPVGADTSERYEYIPASLKVVEDVCLKYACECTIHTATKPPQPIEKSTAGASLLAQVIVAKFLDHLPLHRQQQIFQRHGVDLSRKTMGGWMAQCAVLLGPLWDCAKQYLFQSCVIGTDDTSVKVLDPRLDFARIGRMWPYVGDRDHPVVVFDYTATRARAGPAKFLEGYKGNLQADAYSVYDAFFRPLRGMNEVGCWMHARRYFYKARESDPGRMGPALFLISQLYRVESKIRGLDASQRLTIRQLESKPVMDKLHVWLLQIKPEVLPKSPEGAAVRYTLNQWVALNRYLSDGNLEIDNGEAERANRSVAVGRGNWTFFGSDNGGRTAAVLMTFAASCKRAGVEPFAWFNDVLSRIPEHPITRLAELLPHNWKPVETASVHA